MYRNNVAALKNLTAEEVRVTSVVQVQVLKLRINAQNDCNELEWEIWLSCFKIFSTFTLISEIRSLKT